MSVNYLVYTIGGVVSYLNNAIIYCNITKNKFKKHILYLLMLLVMGVINAYVTIHFPLTIKPIYNLICLILSMYLINKEKLKSILYYVFVIWLLGITLDILFMVLFAPVFNKLLTVYPNFGILVVSLLLQLVLFLVFKIKPFQKLVIKIKQRIDSIHNVTWLFLIITSLVIFFAVTSFTNVNSTKTILMVFILLLIVLFLAVFLIKILYDEKTFKLTIENLLKNNKYYFEINNQNRLFKHNIIHQLNSIMSVSDKKSTKLIEDLISSYEIGNISYQSIDELPNGLNGIISRAIYSKNIKNLEIAVNNYLKHDLFDVLTPRKYNKLCESLGICLDNSLKAVDKAKDKVLQIVLTEDVKNISIKIVNTFNANLEIDNLGTLNYTTKKDGHGIGLYSIFGKKEIKVYSTIINDLFITEIIAKK